MSEERKKIDRAKAARRYAVKRQDPEWMKRQAAKKRSQYKPKNRVSRENSKRRNKALVARMKLSAGSCHDCGLVITVDTLYRFDFDHREPRLKKFTLSDVRTNSVEAILDEIDKCDVVCKNCHADRTHRNRRDEHIAIIGESVRESRRAHRAQPRLFDEA